MSKSSSAPPEEIPRNSDKRDFFRVSHDVLFDLTLVDSFSAENEAAEKAFEDTASLGLVNELRRLDRDNIQTLKLLCEKNRLLGDYLQSLNNKIDLVARHALFAQDESAKNKPKTRINLSEDGLAFIHDRTLYKDSYVAVRLIFLPSYSPVIAFAKVLRCEPKDDRYQIAAKFHKLTDSDRQILSRQIMRAQVQHRKKT